MGVLLKMRSIFSPNHFWDTENMNLNINLNTNLNRYFNFKFFSYDNICLQTSILTWELTKWPHKPTEKLGLGSLLWNALLVHDFFFKFDDFLQFLIYVVKWFLCNKKLRFTDMYCRWGKIFSEVASIIL